MYVLKIKNPDVSNIMNYNIVKFDNTCDPDLYFEIFDATPIDLNNDIFNCNYIFKNILDAKMYMMIKAVKYLENNIKNYTFNLTTLNEYYNITEQEYIFNLNEIKSYILEQYPEYIFYDDIMNKIIN